MWNSATTRLQFHRADGKHFLSAFIARVEVQLLGPQSCSDCRAGMMWSSSYESPHISTILLASRFTPIFSRSKVRLLLVANGSCVVIFSSYLLNSRTALHDVIHGSSHDFVIAPRNVDVTTPHCMSTMLTDMIDEPQYSIQHELTGHVHRASRCGITLVLPAQEIFSRAGALSNECTDVAGLLVLHF